MTTPERIRAEVHRLMAEHVAIAPRGWDARRERADIHARIDAELDPVRARIDAVGRVHPQDARQLTLGR